MQQPLRRVELAYPFKRERELLRRWANSCAAIDAHEILDTCGLSPATSPPSTMDRVYVMGERERDDAGGYSAHDEHGDGPDLEVASCHEFMEWYEVLRPATHAALLARHRRMVSGQLHEDRSERWIAVRLYGWNSGDPDHARNLLIQTCELGYGALRRWLHVMKRTGALPCLN